MKKLLLTITMSFMACTQLSAQAIVVPEGYKAVAINNGLQDQGIVRLDFNGNQVYVAVDGNGNQVYQNPNGGTATVNQGDGVANQVAAEMRNRSEILARAFDYTDRALNIRRHPIEIPSYANEFKSINSSISDLEDGVDTLKEGMAGMMAMSSIDFVERSPGVGVGVGAFENKFGFAIKGMVPLFENAHISIGGFKVNKTEAAAASYVWHF